MSYAFPLERPLPFGAWDTCMGPFVFGSTQVAQFTTRWVCWVATDGMRFGKWNPGMLFNDTDGQADDLYPGGTRPSHLSFSFEQDALHAIAIQTGLNTCEVRRKVSGTPTAYTFTGRTPILFYNGIVEPDTAATDLTCFYIKSAGNKIYARRQRDNFGIEYELNPTLNSTLRALQKTDALVLDDGAFHQLLWAIDTAGRQVYFQSGPYPPFTPYAEDRISLDLGFESGARESNIVFAYSPGDFLTFDQAFEAGVYFSTLIPALPDGLDALSSDQAFEEGLYAEVIIEAQDGDSDAASVDGAFESGSQDLILVESDTPGDAGSIDLAFEDGVYTP